MRLILSASLVSALSALAPSASAGDLGPYYERDEVVIERSAPVRVIERERIIERRYYRPREEVYVAPRQYAPRAYAPYAYYSYDDDDRGYRSAYYAARPWGYRYRYHHHRGW